MNDTKWIANSQQNLEKILAIADDFYDLTKAALNKSKFKLISTKSFASQSIEVNFDSLINLFHLIVATFLTGKILIFNLVVLNPLDRSLKLEYRLDDNSSFILLHDLDINLLILEENMSPFGICLPILIFMSKLLENTQILR
ncbi:14493_t:CDS:2 [Funneliformis geosporum]|nr:14493_t:CDS:2 [Funneliformis geosporum]